MAKQQVTDEIILPPVSVDFNAMVAAINAGKTEEEVIAIATTTSATAEESVALPVIAAKE